MSDKVFMKCILANAPELVPLPSPAQCEHKLLTQTEFLCNADFLAKEEYVLRFDEAFEEGFRNKEFTRRGSLYGVFGKFHYAVIGKGDMGDAVGFTLLTQENDDFGNANWRLDYVMTLENYQGRKSASAVQECIREKASEYAIRELHLQCKPRLQPFYEKFGFQRVVPVPT